MSDPITPNIYLTLADYARHVDKSERTVLRWLNEPTWELAGARRLGDGTWSIPAGAEPIRRPAADIVSIRPPEQPAQITERLPTMVELLDNSPAFLPLNEAEQLLGIPASQIRRRPDVFELAPYGSHGSLVMPLAVVRRFRGDK